MLRRSSHDLENNGEQMSPSQRVIKDRISHVFGREANTTGTLFGYKDRRLIANRKKEPLKSLPVEGLVECRTESASGGAGGGRGAARKIPLHPERILDAPEILNDYYLNPIDWSPHNLLAVALANTVYIWNSANGGVSPLFALAESDYVSSVKWVPEDGSGVLAVGVSTGETMLWNVDQSKKLRTFQGNSNRVSSLSWNQHILSSGDRSGEIRHNDVRTRDSLVAKVNGHNGREVCGLTWSWDGRTLASGGNDNLVKLWNLNQPNIPKTTFSEHKAAVKALAWCPWQSNLLASGAGSADRAINIWNCNTETLVKSVDTKAQVCSVIWSDNYRELASSHGFPSNEIVVWKYPNMTRLAELKGHSDRVLALCLSQDGTTMVSAGADETLQIWKCFPEKAKAKKGHSTTFKKSEKFETINRPGIR